MDFVENATMRIMSRQNYIELDNPKSRIYQQNINYLDNLITRYGGWDED